MHNRHKTAFEIWCDRQDVQPIVCAFGFIAAVAVMYLMAGAFCGMMPWGEP